MSDSPVIPDHSLRRVIGRGAYGEVWLARNVMGAPRAIKIVWRKQFESERPYEREFAGIQKYEPVSRTTDGLVHVLHVGRNNADGYFYYVMELADSAPTATAGDESDFPGYIPRTLRADMKQLGRLPVADCLRVAVDVVGGLARLHERGLVHRDVKPGNIIFVEGRAKLADIGLVSKESEGRTFVGTEGYIPPEGPGSPGADIYALGMVLYEAVTGYPPDRFPSVPSEWFKQDGNAEALEFHEVVLRACEGAKERRYRSAQEMQADLALLQSGQSVRHLRALEERVARWRRIGWGAAATVGIAVTAALGANWRASVAAESKARETKLLAEANASLARAEKAEQASQLQLYSALLEQARATVRSADLGQRVRALDAIRRAAAISNSVDLRREVAAALALPDLKLDRVLPYNREFTARELDPHFQRVALVRGMGPLEIRSVADDHLIASMPASTNLVAFNISWSNDGEYIALKRDYDRTGFGGDLEVWHIAQKRRVLLLHNVRWSAIAFHPSQPTLLTGTTGGLVIGWNLTTGEECSRKKVVRSPELIAYSTDGSKVAETYVEKGVSSLLVSKAKDWSILASNTFPIRVSVFAWHPDGRHLAVTDNGGGVQIYDTETGDARLIGRHKAEAVSAAWSSDGAYLITGGWERELICWDFAGMRRAFSVALNSYHARFRADGKACVLLTSPGLRVYHFELPVTHQEFKEDLGPRLRHASFSPDGRWLAASADNGVGVWDLDSKAPAAINSQVFNATCYFTSDSQEIFGSIGRPPGKPCFRWRVLPSPGRGIPPTIEQLPFSEPDGFTSLSIHSNSVVLTTTNGSQILPLNYNGPPKSDWAKTSDGINGVSPDGRWLGMYRAYSESLYVYELPGMHRVAKLRHPGSIGDFRFSPLGNELAIASRTGVEFWSTDTWQQTRALTNYQNPLRPGQPNRLAPPRCSHRGAL